MSHQDRACPSTGIAGLPWAHQAPTEVLCVVQCVVLCGPQTHRFRGPQPFSAQPTLFCASFCTDIKAGLALWRCKVSLIACWVLTALCFEQSGVANDCGKCRHLGAPGLRGWIILPRLCWSATTDWFQLTFSRQINEVEINPAEIKLKITLTLNK